MRVGVGKNGARQRQPLLGDEYMGNAMYANGKIILHTEVLRKLADALGHIGCLDRRGGHHVVVQQDQHVRIGDLHHVGSHEVEEHRRVDIDHHHVARLDHRLVGMSHQDLLDRRHTHCAKPTFTGG